MEWFYPQNLALVIESTLNCFYEDDEVVHACLSLLIEFANNRCGRLQFNTWSLNGLIVFKESCKYVVKLIQVWHCLQSKTGNLKFIKQLCLHMIKVVSGNYVNFAICDYYQDAQFATLC